MQSPKSKEKTKHRKALFGVSFAALSMALCPLAFAEPRTFNVPAEDAVEAIPEFARQAGVQIIAPARDLRGRQTPAVQGTMEPREALARLLEGTGLEVASNDGRIITLRRAGQGDQASPTQLGAADDAAPSSEADEEIVVTGSRLPGASSTAPTVTLSREDIERSGASSVDDLMATLPQNFAGVTPDGRFSNEGGSRVARLNDDRVVGIDLRGLGPESTLTLINGQRRAGSIDGRVVDVGSIPLSAIDRVEVVTGGRSAIYGSDAVAGVVNFITRRDFEGAQTQAYYGTRADGNGGERLQLGHVFGVDQERAGFVASYDYTRDWALDLADINLLSQAPVSGITQRNLNAQADAWTHSVFAAGRLQLTDSLELVADGSYTNRKYKDDDRRSRAGAPSDSFSNTTDNSEQINLSVGLLAELGRDWRLNASAARSEVAHDRHSFAFDDFGAFTATNIFDDDDKSELTTYSLVADGPLFEIAGVTPRIAVGVEYRDESFKTHPLSNGAPFGTYEGQRNVRSAFAELLLPLITGPHRLEVSLAGRFDDYSDFGDTFNPQAGVVWEPVSGLSLRGAYSEAFRAPSLIELRSTTTVLIQRVTDPTQGNALVPVLFALGDNPGLQPEEAETWSAGIDFRPPQASWAQISLSYFDIAYDGRIETALGNSERPLALQRESRFPDLITRGPTAAEASALAALANNPPVVLNLTGIPWNPATTPILTAFPNLVLFDNRTSNLASETVRGVDLSIRTTFDAGASEIYLGFDATFTLEHQRAVSATSPSFELLNEVGKPVDFRFRAHAGVTQGPFSAFAFLNYTDSYDNPFSTPRSTMDAWTTVDLTLAYDPRRQPEATSFPVRASLSIQNLLDEDPPRFANSIQGVLYDTANASSRGRYIGLTLTHDW